MKTLVLSSGVNLEVEDASTFADIVKISDSRSEAARFWDNFTEASLKGAKLDGETFTAIPQSMRADLNKETGKIEAHYLNYVTDPKPVPPEPVDPEEK